MQILVLGWPDNWNPASHQLLSRSSLSIATTFGINFAFPTTLSFNIPASRDKVSFILIYRWRCLPSVMLTVKSDFETRETSFETQALSLVMWSEQTVYHPWVSGSLTMKWERQLCHSQKAERMKSDAGCESLNLKSNLSFPDAQAPCH